MGGTFDALVTVHGYNPKGMEGGRDPVDVWDDRLSTGKYTADTLREFGANVVLAIPGGGDYDGKTEAEIIADYAYEEFPDLMNNYDFVLEGNSTNTRENIERMYSLASCFDVSAVFTVSSRDHTPRVLYGWQEFIDEDDDFMVGGVCSDEPYTESELGPLLMEPAEFEPFVEAFSEAWLVDPEFYEDAAEEVAEVLRKYQDV